MHELLNDIVLQIRAIWRYRWYAILFAWIIALSGWAIVHMMPDRYKADAQVYLDNDSVLRPLLAGLSIQPDLDQIAAMVSQTLLTRANLARVMRMADLDIGTKSGEEQARIIDRLSKEISIRSVGSRNVYSISFAHENPRVAQRVVESLVELFVERSVNDNREDSDSARRFIDQQLETYRLKLEAAENAVTAFKRKHIQVLPGAGPKYFDRLVEAKEGLRKAELDVRVAEDSAASIRKELASAAASLTVEAPGEQGGGGAVKDETELDVRIRVLEQKLDDLRLRYTDQHPDVIALVGTITKLKEQKEAETKLLREKTATDTLMTRKSPETARMENPLYQQLTVSLTAAEAEVAAKKARLAEYQRHYRELQVAANAVPQVEAEYAQLTRDYEITKARYDELLQRRQTALLSEDVEKRHATMGFKVIDPPQLQLRTEPNRPLLMTLVLAAALCGGLGGAWLISQIRPTIDDERRLREVSGLPVLGTLVMAWTDEQKARRNWGVAAFITSCTSLISAYMAIMVMLVLNVSKV